MPRLAGISCGFLDDPQSQSLTGAGLYVIVIRTSKALEMGNETPILSVRISRDERAMLEAAAADARTSISDFVRRKAVEAAEMDVLDRRVVTIPVADWEKFEDWVKAPGRDVPALRKLAATRPAWQD